MQTEKGFLLEAKIKKPRLIRSYIRRERLMEQIEESSERILVFHGAMGFGKTMLMNAYGQEKDRHCLWYHLNRQDRERRVFCRYLRRALELSEGSGFLWREDAESSAEIAGAINRVCESLLEQEELILMLDDFQAVEDSELCDFLAEVIQNTTQRFRIFLTTKGTLPRFLLRCLLDGEARIFEDWDLAFSREETFQLLKAGQPGGVQPEEAEKIYCYTEGWPAGVMFFNLQQKQEKGRERQNRLQQMAGSSLIHDYIMYELFRKLPFEIQDFLKKTSVLEYLDKGICNAVAKVQNSAGQLDYLVQENLFIQKIEGAVDTYRYHALFRGFLREQLTPEENREACSRAALFCLRHEQKEEALEYAMESGSRDQVEKVLELAGFSLLEEGRQMIIEQAVEICRQGERGQKTQENEFLLALEGLLSCRRGKHEDSEKIFLAMELARKNQNMSGYSEILHGAARLFWQEGNYGEADRLLGDLMMHLEPGEYSWYEAAFTRIFLNFSMARPEAAQRLCRFMAEKPEKRSRITEKNRRQIQKFRTLADQLCKAWDGELKEIVYEQVFLDGRDEKISSLLEAMFRFRKLEREFLEGKDGSGELEKTVESPGDTWIAAEIYMEAGAVSFRLGERERGLAFLKKAEAIRLERGLTRSFLNPVLVRSALEIGLLREPGNRCHVYVECFGEFGLRVLETGDEVKWRTSKAKACMAYLFHMGQPVSRRQILEALWEDADALPANEVAALHNIFSSIRRSLEPFGLDGVIRYEEKRYSLDRSLILSFRPQMDSFAAKAGRGDKKGVLESAMIAASVCRGHYLEDIDLSWCMEVRTYYESRLHEGFSMAGRELKREGDWAGALTYLKKAESVSPCRPENGAAILECLGEWKDRAALIGTYREMERNYEKNLGEKPGPTLSKAFREALAKCR